MLQDAAGWAAILRMYVHVLWCRRKMATITTPVIPQATLSHSHPVYIASTYIYTRIHIHQLWWVSCTRDTILYRLAQVQSLLSYRLMATLKIGGCLFMGIIILWMVALQSIPCACMCYVELSFMGYQWVNIMSLGQDTQYKLCGGVHVYRMLYQWVYSSWAGQWRLYCSAYFQC